MYADIGVGSFWANAAEAYAARCWAVRFYERRGLLHPGPRTAGGYRTFEDRDVERVRLARQLQQLGLTVGEIVDALAAHDVGSATCASERWRLEQVAARVEAQLAELRRTRRSIRDALAACDQGHCRLSDASAG